MINATMKKIITLLLAAAMMTPVMVMAAGGGVKLYEAPIDINDKESSAPWC